MRLGWGGFPGMIGAGANDACSFPCPIHPNVLGTAPWISTGAGLSLCSLSTDRVTLTLASVAYRDQAMPQTSLVPGTTAGARALLSLRLWSQAPQSHEETPLSCISRLQCQGPGWDRPGWLSLKFLPLPSVPRILDPFYR